MGGRTEQYKAARDTKRNHWWDDRFREKAATEWMDQLPGKRNWDEEGKKGFTLTSGELDGLWRTSGDPNRGDGHAGTVSGLATQHG